MLVMIYAVALSFNHINENIQEHCKQ